MIKNLVWSSIVIVCVSCISEYMHGIVRTIPRFVFIKQFQKTVEENVTHFEKVYLFEEWFNVRIIYAIGYLIYELEVSEVLLFYLL